MGREEGAKDGCFWLLGVVLKPREELVVFKTNAYGQENSRYTELWKEMQVEIHRGLQVI